MHRNRFLCRLAAKVISVTMALPFYLAYPRWFLKRVGKVFMWAVEYAEGC